MGLERICNYWLIWTSYKWLTISYFHTFTILFTDSPVDLPILLQIYGLLFLISTITTRCFMPWVYKEFSNFYPSPPHPAITDQIGESRCVVMKQSSRSRRLSSFGIEFISILLSSTSLIILKERSILLNYGFTLLMTVLLLLYYLLFYSTSDIEEVLVSCYLSVITHR